MRLISSLLNHSKDCNHQDLEFSELNQAQYPSLNIEVPRFQFFTLFHERQDRVLVEHIVASLVVTKTPFATQLFLVLQVCKPIEDCTDQLQADYYRYLFHHLALICLSTTKTRFL